LLAGPVLDKLGLEIRTDYAVNARAIAWLVVLLLIVAGAAWLRWKEGELQPDALQPTGKFDTALRTGNSANLLKLVCTPAAVQGRTAPGQTEFLTKALADEISPQGLNKTWD
jgi:hypothetical protein